MKQPEQNKGVARVGMDDCNMHGCDFIILNICRSILIFADHVDSRRQVFGVSNILKNIVICMGVILSFLILSSTAGMGAELQTVSNRLES